MGIERVKSSGSEFGLVRATLNGKETVIWLWMGLLTGSETELWSGKEFGWATEMSFASEWLT